jgi:hypothetical protein
MVPVLSITDLPHPEIIVRDLYCPEARLPTVAAFHNKKTSSFQVTTRKNLPLPPAVEPAAPDCSKQLLARRKSSIKQIKYNMNKRGMYNITYQKQSIYKLTLRA